MRHSRLATGLLVAVIGATAAAATVVTPSPTQAARARACFLPSDVRNWSDGGRLTLNLLTDRKEVYNLALIGPDCAGIDWSTHLAIVPRFGLRVCEGDDATLVWPQPFNRRGTCRAMDIRKLTPEQVASLPKKYRP